MNQLYIRGGRTLEGEVRVQGRKNSVLPILAATLLTRGQVRLEGCPRLRDVDASIRSCGIWGAVPVGGGHPGGGHRRPEPVLHLRYTDEGNALVRHFSGSDPGPMRPGGHQLPRRMRAGPPAHRPASGGAAGTGAQIREEGGFLTPPPHSYGARTVVLRLPSVGATENLILAACGAEGTTAHPTPPGSRRSRICKASSMPAAATSGAPAPPRW